MYERKLDILVSLETPTGFLSQDVSGILINPSLKVHAWTDTIEILVSQEFLKIKVFLDRRWRNRDHPTL